MNHKWELPVIVTGEAKDGGDGGHSGKCRGGTKGRRRSAGALKPLSSSFINSRDCYSPSPVTHKTLGMKRTLNGNCVPKRESQNKDNVVMVKRQTVIRKQKASSSKCLHLKNQNAYSVGGRIPVKRLKGDKIIVPSHARCNLDALQTSFGRSFSALLKC